MILIIPMTFVVALLVTMAVGMIFNWDDATEVDIVFAVVVVCLLAVLFIFVGGVLFSPVGIQLSSGRKAALEPETLN
jgi:hypothetical protein